MPLGGPHRNENLAGVYFLLIHINVLTALRACRFECSCVFVFSFQWLTVVHWKAQKTDWLHIPTQHSVLRPPTPAVLDTLSPENQPGPVWPLVAGLGVSQLAQVASYRKLVCSLMK